LRTASAYQGPLQSAIRALKYNGNTRLAHPLGHILASAYLAYHLQADYIIPVPLHSERHKQRGYNHAQLLAEVMAAQINKPLSTNIVIRQRDTPAQVGLGNNERRQNMANAFILTPPYNIANSLANHHILLIDDVYTTGSTLSACADPLFASGAASVWGLVLARPS
jgi:ComF family protein